MLRRVISLLPLFCIFLFQFKMAQAQYPAIVIPIKKEYPVEFFTLDLDENFHGDLPKKNFKKIESEKGEVFEISSYVISQNLLANMAGLMRGTDAPELADIENEIDLNDPKRFLALLVEVARERRHAESFEDWDEIETRFGRGISRARFNAYLFSTAYLEVTPMSLKSGKKDSKRYFVPVSQVIEGAGEIDVKAAKVRVLSSLSIMAFEELDPAKGFDLDLLKAKETQSTLQEMAKAVEKICHSDSACNLLGQAKMGPYMADFHRVYRLGDRLNLSDSDRALLKLRKQLCLFKLLHDAFPNIPGLEQVDKLIQAMELNCDSRESVLNNLVELD